MQWHWGNIGSAMQGFAVVIIAIGALFKGPAVVRAWIEGKQAEAEETRTRAETARAQATERELTRRAELLGWASNGVTTFTTALVTDPAEMEKATAELAVQKPGTDGPSSAYVVLRVDEGIGSESRARDLRALISQTRFIGRPPTPAEREAVEAGIEVLGLRTPRSL